MVTNEEEVELQVCRKQQVISTSYWDYPQSTKVAHTLYLFTVCREWVCPWHDELPCSWPRNLHHFQWQRHLQRTRSGIIDYRRVFLYSIRTRTTWRVLSVSWTLLLSLWVFSSLVCPWTPLRSNTCHLVTCLSQTSFWLLSANFVPRQHLDVFRRNNSVVGMQ